MVTLIIRKGIHCFNLPQIMKDKIMKDLTFDNPKYIQAKKYGLFIGSDTPPKLQFFSYRRQEDVFYIPRGYLFYLIKTMKAECVEFKIEDKTTLLPKLDVSFKGIPRDYQKIAVDKMSKYPIGVLESSTGSGKTFMGINLIAIRRQPTLIIVHTKELVQQWLKSIKDFLGYDAGVLGDGKFILKDISVGIVQTVRNNMEELKDRFGHVICDETHRCPSTMWTDVLSQFSARYYLGLSATAIRNDGLGEAIFAFIGPKIHRVDPTHLQDVGAVLKPQVIRVPTRYGYMYRGDYSSMVSDLASNEVRNRLIVECICRDIKLYNSSILVVSDRVQHCVELQSILDSKKIKSVLLASNLSTENRKKIVADMKSGKEKVAFATVQLVGEGFDAKNIHAIFLCTPIKWKGRLVQVVGRVLRPEDGKTARVYDFRDDNVAALRKIGKERDKTYKTYWGNV